MLSVAGDAGLPAHRTDEYLQAARLAVESGRVELELDLTPGIAIAETIINDIDRDRDGSLSAEEQRAYAGVVLRALALDVDGSPLRPELTAATFAAVDAIRRGEGAIRLHAAATLPRLSSGVHHLSFRNRHHPDGSVYLANALVPASDRVSVTAQRRDDTQTELTIDYVLRAAPAGSTAAWLLGAAAAVTLLSALMIHSRRAIGYH